MQKTQRLIKLGQLALLLAGAACVAACDDDSNKPKHVEDAGEEPGPVDSDAGMEDAETPDPEDPIDPVDPTPAKQKVLVATTDYASTEVFLHNLTDKKVEGDAIKFEDGDVVLASSGGQVFALERTRDVVHVFEDGKLRKFSEQQASGIALGDGESSLNPQTVVVVPGQDRAWVPLYNQPKLVQIDLVKGSVEQTLDISEFQDASDADGSPDAADGVYDPETKLVYFTLQRIDLSSFPIACAARRSLLIALDPETSKLVDLNGDADGKAVALTLTNPSSLSLEAEKGRLLILATGCTDAETGERAEQGIEAFDLKTRKTKVLYEAPAAEYHTSLTRVSDGQYLLGGYDAAWASVHALWNEEKNQLGAPLANVPKGAVAFEPGSLLGVRAPEAEGATGYELVSYDVAKDSATPLVKNTKAATLVGVSSVVELP